MSLSTATAATSLDCRRSGIASKALMSSWIQNPTLAGNTVIPILDPHSVPHIACLLSILAFSSYSNFWASCKVFMRNGSESILACLNAVYKTSHFSLRMSILSGNLSQAAEAPYQLLPKFRSAVANSMIALVVARTSVAIIRNVVLYALPS